MIFYIVIQSIFKNAYKFKKKLVWFGVLKQ